MERTPDRLAWLALLIVDEAAEQAEKGRVEKTIGLRLALAYLASIADGPIYDLPSRRYIFDHFWMLVTEPDGRGTPHMQIYSRSSHSSGCLQQIGRQTQFGAGIFTTVRASRTPQGRANSRSRER